jgi:NAD(P)-dependent dehydrogenase (short-subunit alcohol dehydrogenase family)
MRFIGKTVVITGAGRGIGRVCAERFAAEGAELVLVARSADELRALALQIGPQARAVACDVTDAVAVAALFDGLANCDVLFNNAGSNTPQAFVDVDLATLDRLLTLNVRSAFVVAQAATRAMLRTGRGGSIINMSSQMGHVGAANRTVYCTSKHAIEGLTKAMAVELAPQGIRVNAVAPTYIETPLTAPFFADPQFKADTLRRIPIGRIGTVAEVAAAVAFLASSEASLITGTSLLVDGGYTAQ